MIESVASVPAPAATVVLARDVEGGGFEVFLVQRHERVGFMGGMHVFPGGKLAAGDASELMCDRIADRSVHAGVWGDAFDDANSCALAVAAIRETFEEAGVLLGADAQAPELIDLRVRLLAGDDFAALLDEARLRIDISALTPLSRWITPEQEPRRYDTCFYVAQAPSNQDAAHDRRETIAGSWFAPRTALEKMQAAELRLAPPTARTLESLADCGSVAAVRELALTRPPPLIQPVIAERDGKVLIFYPGDSEHPVRERALPGPTRAVLRHR